MRLRHFIPVLVLSWFVTAWSVPSAYADSECGNSLVEDPEQCDDGNTASGDCCSFACAFEFGGQPCAEDGSVCTDDICNGEGSCIHWPDSKVGVLCREGGSVSTTGPSVLPAGAQEFPVGIDEDFFSTHECGPDTEVTFYPTSASNCTGFHTFTHKPAGAAMLKSIIDGVQDNTFSSPPTIAGETVFEFVGGTVASGVSSMQSLFNAKKGPDGTWAVLVPVYQASGCANPSSSLLIVGFATVRFTKIQTAPVNSVMGTVDCNIIEIGEGGGPDFGTLFATSEQCNPAEYCDGVSPSCPADVMPSEETPCDADSLACTADACNGAGACVHDPGNAGTVCRAAAGACDLPEICDGVSSSCPANLRSTAVCRSSAGVCDPAESCTGLSNGCPIDVRSSGECRGAAGLCDVAETCNGISTDCPFDAKRTTECRSSVGLCDAAESCDGIGNDCPVDAFAPADTVCRSTAGECDLEESCDGLGACPADARSVAVCRDAVGVCDAMESCDGTADHCPADAKLSTDCRGTQGVCDLTETCNGVADDCPIDALLSSGTTCRGATDVCDSAEQCDGVSATCPQDAFLEATSECRASGGVCDAAELCTGAGAACPPDSFMAAATTCRAVTGACDLAEACTGLSTECPSDALAGSGSPCRESVGDCDAPEVCDGVGAQCPVDSAAELGTTCTADPDECTDDYCDGAGTCAHPPIALAPVCNWAVVGGSDTRESKVRTRVESTIGGAVCADRADIGPSSALVAPGSWVLLEDSGNAASVRANAAVLDGSAVTAGGCLRGFGGLPIFGTVEGPICCADGDVVLPGGIVSNVINACGSHPLVDQCRVAKAQVPDDIALLASLASSADLGNLTVAPDESSVIMADAGLNVIDVDRLRLARSATLTIDAGGNTDSVVILRIASGLSSKKGATIELTGGATAENVLFYAADGNCTLGLGTQGAGTVFCPEGSLRVREAAEWSGAFAGGSSIDVGWNVTLMHVPFLGLAAD